MAEHDNHKKKVRLSFDRQEAATYLRRLADQIEKDAIQLDCDGQCFNGAVEITESIKHKPNKSLLKIALKLAMCTEKGIDVSEAGNPAEKAGSGDEPSEPAPSERKDKGPAATGDEEKRPSYKELKKNMSKNFSEIGTLLKSNQMPGAELVNAFESDCRLLITYSGKGDANYPAFEKAVKAFMQAVASGDVDAAAQRRRELKERRSLCHDEYK